MSSSARDLLAAYRSRRLRPSEVVELLRDRMLARQPVVGAFTATRWDAALAEARDWDAAYERGDAAGALAGVPFAVKDLVDTQDLPTAYGSPLFAGHRPERDAGAVAAVRRAGGILVGKTVTHEFAWGITSLHDDGPQCRNPHDPARIAGGSSGGSAVAVADGQAPLAIGTDTAGSIRIPAAFCGVAGFKPTFGTVSTDGVWPLAPSLDHVGALAGSPADAALLVDVMAGRAPRGAGAPARTVAVAPDLPGPQRHAIHAAGLATAAVAPPPERDALAILREIQAAESYKVHADAGLYPAQRPRYGADVRGRLDAAARRPARAHPDALRARHELAARLPEILGGHAVLATLVADGPPPTVAEVQGPEADAALRDAVLPHTALQSLLGLPACVVPIGVVDGLPVALQLSGPPGADDVVVATAQAVAEAVSH